MALEPNDLIAWQRLAQYRNLDEFRGLKAILAPELSHCFNQEVHEGQKLPYGVLIARDDDMDDLGRLVEIADERQLARSADGVNALAFRTKNSGSRLLRLAEPLDSQDACSYVAGLVDGVICRVDAAGMIWVVSSDNLTTIDDRGGRTRPSTDRIVGELSQLAVTAEPTVLRAISSLAYSYFSPRRIGTTILYLLTNEDDHSRQSEGQTIAELGLNVVTIADWPEIEHQLRHVDGAAVVDRNGQLLRKAVMLNASEDAQQTETEGGARHNSACRHTYDRPDVLAFVISADGPVTIYADGARSTSLILPDRERPWNPSGGEMWTQERQCPSCGSDLVIRNIVLYGFRDNEEGYCPICKAEAASLHGWAIEIGLTKSLRTIERIRQYRQQVAQRIAQ